MELSTEPMTREAIQEWLNTARSNFQTGQSVKTIDEARALPISGPFALVPGFAPDGTPCKIPLRIGHAQVFANDDIVEFIDTDGTPMRVMSTLIGLRKTPIK